MKVRSKFHRFGAIGSKQVSAEVSADIAPKAASANEAVEKTRGPREIITQAARDISRGLRDTDLHGTPSNVPGPGAQPENSPGAEVPPDGVDVHK